ncbi:MAG: GNAT family N-acetyltransferase [Alphaproteobacteria bacterium]|nr:GNAT family N-acetyltransferase [Alphaproteobacteria bacterium]
MILGPAFLRQNFLAAFSAPLATPHAVLKQAADENAAVMADFFKADDYVVVKAWGWDPEDYTADYVATALIPHLDMCDQESNKLTLNIYTPNQDRQLGYLEFYANGRMQLPFVSCRLLPSCQDLVLVHEVYEAALVQAEKAGLVQTPKTPLPAMMREAFTRAAAGRVETARLHIRPYHPADSDKIALYPYEGGHECSGYFAKEVAGIEMGQLYAGIFAKVTGELVGELGFWQDELERSRMSYQIKPVWRGQGLASEAHQAGLAWTDRFLPQPIRCAEFVLGNHQSQSVLRKSGFNRTGEVTCQTPGFEGVTVVVMERPQAGFAPAGL